MVTVASLGLGVLAVEATVKVAGGGHRTIL
jgi:hypothetical protein